MAIVGLKIDDAGYWILDTRYEIQDFRIEGLMNADWMLDAGFLMLDTRYRIPGYFSFKEKTGGEKAKR